MSTKEKKIKKVHGRLDRNKIRDNAFAGTVEVSKLFDVENDI